MATDWEDVIYAIILHPHVTMLMVMDGLEVDAWSLTDNSIVVLGHEQSENVHLNALDIIYKL